MNKLIKNACIMTMDADNTIIENGYIGIEAGLITYVSADFPATFMPHMIIDAKEKIVMPGLVNAHTHTPMILLRNYADDLPLQQWLFDKIFPMEDKLTAEDAYWACQLSMMEMLKSGVTCFSDMYFYMEEVAKAVNKAGMRSNLSRGLQCFNDDFDVMTDERLLENEQLFKDWHGEANGRIKVSVGPHALYTCVPEYLKASVELAKRLETGIHIHVSETQKERDECIEKYGKTPVKHLADLGVFEVNTLAAHCVHVSDEDLDILKQHHVNVVYNPGSNLKLGSGIAPVTKMIERGINVALATDGAASNNNLNMFEEIHLAALISKGVLEDPTAITAEKALQMATLNGAKALGNDRETGSIKVGMKADLIIVSKKSPHFYPRNDITANLVYATQASDVETVLVEGQILMDKGDFKTIDTEEVLYHIDKISKRLFEVS